MLNILKRNKKKYNIRTKELIYQYADGRYLPDSSQPEPANPKLYTPHKSTRYKKVIIGSNGLAQMLINGQAIDAEKALPQLYENRENCCGCTACYAICPFSGSNRSNDDKVELDYSSSCITMEPDEEGFLYPVVNALLCIRCYKCLSVCSFKNKQKEKGYIKGLINNQSYEE